MLVFSLFASYLAPVQMSDLTIRGPGKPLVTN
jgi:hypothetical protein